MNELYVLTSEELKNGIEDDSRLYAEFERQNIAIKLSIWNKEFIPDNSTVFIRTIWDYPLHREEFSKLLNDFKQRNIRCINPLETLVWNMDKTYLKELFDQRVCVVPSEIFDSFNLNDLDLSNFPVVIKPLVGASGRDTYLIKNEESIPNLTNLIGSQVLIQPFMENIQKEGEFSFIYFGGEFSHAILKTAKKNEFRIQEEYGGQVRLYKPSVFELEQIGQMLGAINYDWIYARVDVVNHNNKLTLMELELIEPELFFRFSENGEKALVNAIKAKL